MPVLTLIMTTVAALAMSFIAFLAVIKMMYKRIDKQNTSNANSKGAEDLLELITSAPLSEILSAGDKVEIVVCTNGHPIASREYTACDWQGKVKLSGTKVIKG